MLKDNGARSNLLWSGPQHVRGRMPAHLPQILDDVHQVGLGLIDANDVRESLGRASDWLHIVGEPEAFRQRLLIDEHHQRALPHNQPRK